MERLVKKISGEFVGEIFIETPNKKWRDRLDAWLADSTNPCPMPRGHLMFKHPEDYRCVRISNTK